MGGVTLRMKALLLYSILLLLPSINTCHGRVSELTNGKIIVKKTYYDPSVKVDDDNIPLDSTQWYFPITVDTDSVVAERFVLYTYHTHIDSFCNSWYSQQLYAMHEPILYNKPMDKEVIRFTWLRTFHNPIAIRIEKSSQGITMYWKRCDGAGGYEPGKLIANKKKGITEEQWQQLMSLLDKASFWNPVLEEEEIGFDGAQWIVEAAGGDFYHVMHTWSGGKLEPIGKYLLALTEMKIKQSEIY